MSVSLETIMKLWENDVFVLVVGLTSVLLAAWSAWKSRRAEGRDFVNDVMTDVGGGSFIGSLIYKISGFFWGLAALGFFVLSLTSLYTLLDRYSLLN
jgi:hypothetical protein